MEGGERPTRPDNESLVSANSGRSTAHSSPRLHLPASLSSTSLTTSASVDQQRPPPMGPFGQAATVGHHTAAAAAAVAPSQHASNVALEMIASTSTTTTATSSSSSNQQQQSRLRQQAPAVVAASAVAVPPSQQRRPAPPPIPPLAAAAALQPLVPERETEGHSDWDGGDDDEGLFDGDNNRYNHRDSNRFTTLSGWSLVELAPAGGGGGIPPSARSLHAGAVLNGVMYLFGGFDGTQRVNSFHAFHFGEKRWSPVMPSAHSAPPPSPRDRHVAAAFGTSFYVHGGFDGRSRVGDFHAFDFSTMTWREITSTRPPSARHSHSAVVHGHSLYIAFGYDGSYKNDLHEFDFVASRWSAVPAAGRRPRARYRSTAVVFKKYMIVHGGHDGVRHLSDTHLFDFDAQTWSNLVTDGIPPTPRDSHVSVMQGSSMFVFAGSSGSAMNDLHELQFLTASTTSAPLSSTSASLSQPMARWRAVTTSARGYQPRHRFCHVGVVHNNSLYVHGGYDGGERLNDFVKFDFTVYDLSFEVPPSTLISDLKAMINDSAMSDVTFLVEGQRVYAHKLMLMRCSYFQALFLGPMRESRMTEIPLPQVGHSVFLAILEYLYTDRLKIPFHLAMEIFEAADLFCINRLKTMCEKRMLQSISVENAATIFHAADMHSASALRQKAKKYILSHFEDVSKSAGFEEMGRSNIELVFELLQCR